MDIETAEKLVGKVVAFETLFCDMDPFTVHDIIRAWNAIRIWAYGSVVEIKLDHVIAYTVFQPGERIECK